MFAAVDIGGTKLLAASARPEADGWRLGPPLRRPTPPEGGLETLGAMVEEVCGGAPPEAVAMAVPGPFDRAAGRLVDPPNMPRTWWGLPLAEHLGGRFGCPVVMENDANCAALAEARWGAAAGTRSSVYMTVSTGIGCGMVVDGRLLAVRNDTEAGHMVLWPRWLGAPSCLCGGAGCLEALASGGAILRRFGRRAEDLDDQDAWDDVGRWLGLAVVNLTASHDCEAVVLGGGVVDSADRFWPALTATVADALHILPPPRILRAALGVDRNLLGALCLTGC